jgi:hypothetical protein
MNLDNGEKAKILCEFKDGFEAYKTELAEGYDEDENYWHGFGFQIGDVWKVFDLRFCLLDGEILCTAYRCYDPHKNGEYQTDCSEGWCLI